MHIVVVEDQPVEREFYHSTLQKNGFEVLSFKDSLTALDYLRSNRADLTLIDYSLIGGPNGLTLARYVRKLYPADAIVLISAFATIDALVDAIQIGVDDFIIIKPIRAEELLKRLDEAVMRRREWFPKPEPAKIFDSGLALDLSARTAFWHGEQLSLTPSQFAILAQLASNPGRVFGYSELYALSRGERLSPTEARSRLKSHMVNLRAKLEKNGHPQAIYNVRGMGFKWVPSGYHGEDEGLPKPPK
jgi:DNA-binding response OmpR family regulator